MASLNATIDRKMKDFPMMYHHRVDALHHLYLVNGNGYDWYNGELVDDLPDEKRPKIGAPAADAKFARRYRLTPAQYRQVSAALSRWKLNREYFSWYPVCAWASIVEIPRNAKQDWRRGAVEIALYVLANPEYADVPERFLLIKVCMAVLAKYWNITKAILTES